MAFGGRANAFDARRRDKYRRGVARGHIIDDVVEVEEGARFRALVVEAAFFVRVVHAHKFLRFARVIQAQIIVDRLGREHGGQMLGEGLQPVERAIPTDTNQSLDAEPL